MCRCSQTFFNLPFLSYFDDLFGFNVVETIIVDIDVLMVVVVVVVVVVVGLGIANNVLTKLIIIIYDICLKFTTIGSVLH